MSLWTGRRRQLFTLVGLSSIGLSSPLQQGLVIPALPGLARDLHTSTGWATWVLTLYLLSSAVAAPLVGRLGDQFGKKRVVVIATAVIFCAAIGATFAWDIWSLIVFRGLAGLGGGACFALAISIARDEFRASKLPMAIGLMMASFAVGGASGIAVSGFVVDQLSWRWLFLIGAIAAGVASAAIAWLVPESPSRASSQLDLPGAALFAGGALCLLLALTEVQKWGPTSARILGLFAAAVVALTAWVRLEAQAPAPMINVRLLMRRPVLLTNLVTLLNGVVIFGTFVLAPHLVEAPRGLDAAAARLVDYGFGASASHIGLYLAPAVAMQMLSGPLAGALGARLGSKWPLALGLIVEAAGAAGIALWHDTPARVIGGLLVLGTGFGLSGAAAPRLVAEAVEPTETGVVLGMNSFMLLVGGVVAGQLVAVLLAADTIGASDVPAESAFSAGFWGFGVAALVGLALALLIRRKARPLLAEPGGARAG